MPDSNKFHLAAFKVQTSYAPEICLDSRSTSSNFRLGAVFISVIMKEGFQEKDNGDCRGIPPGHAQGEPVGNKLSRSDDSDDNGRGRNEQSGLNPLQSPPAFQK